MHEYDVKKVHKNLYSPSLEPTLVQVPQQVYCMVEGEGRAQDEAYEVAVKLLFAMSTALQKEFGRHRLYQSFIIAPLECVWSPLQEENRQTWRYSAMIAQPDWLDEQIFLQVRDQVAFTQGLPALDVHLGSLEEGLCVTILHIGSYKDEGRSMESMQAFCDTHSLKRVGSSHREIYLSNPSHTHSSLLNTVLRFPVERI